MGEGVGQQVAAARLTHAPRLGSIVIAAVAAASSQLAFCLSVS